MKLTYIDSIRGIAILMVILVHAAQSVPGLSPLVAQLTEYGQMGVQLFFVASAYTLCLSATKRGGESHEYTKYAIRRYFRIAPLYYMGIVIYFVRALLQARAGIEGYTDLEDYSVPNVLTNVFFVHGFYPPANNTIVPGGWSIGTEVAFYVIFPILFYLASRAGIGQRYTRLALWVLTGLVLSQIAIFTLSLIGWQPVNNSFVYYNLVNQLPVFFVGMAYFFLRPAQNLRHHWGIDLAGYLALTLAALALWQLRGYAFSVIPFVSALSFVFLMELFRKVPALNLTLLVNVGRASYSMYLLHFLFAHTAAKMLVPTLSRYFSTGATLTLIYVGSVAASYVLAKLSEAYVENRFIQLGHRLVNRLDRGAAVRER